MSAKNYLKSTSLNKETIRSSNLQSKREQTRTTSQIVLTPKTITNQCSRIRNGFQTNKNPKSIMYNLTLLLLIFMSSVTRDQRNQNCKSCKSIEEINQIYQIIKEINLWFIWPKLIVVFTWNLTGGDDNTPGRKIWVKIGKEI